MDKGYQIFIGSTFVDLRDERQAVLKAIMDRPWKRTCLG